MRRQDVWQAENNYGLGKSRLRLLRGGREPRERALNKAVWLPVLAWRGAAFRRLELFWNMRGQEARLFCRGAGVSCRGRRGAVKLWRRGAGAKPLIQDAEREMRLGGIAVSCGKTVKITANQPPAGGFFMSGFGLWQKAAGARVFLLLNLVFMDRRLKAAGDFAVLRR